MTNSPSTAIGPILQEMRSAHPMESSRLLIALLSLVQDGDAVDFQESPQPLIAVAVLRNLMSAIHYRDVGTLKHSRRVGLISIGIASRLGWEDDDLRIIEISSLLHDVGKIGVPDHILRKPGKLSPDESEFIAMHHRVALSLLQACRVHPDITHIISQAHGISEEDRQERNSLGLGSRILSVADAYDSLTTRQCFRASYDRWEALQILEEQSGKQFDRNVVAALGRWLDGPDAVALADERAAEVSIQLNAPVDVETRNNAALLCQVFNHLYLLESLYDAFYVVNAHHRVVTWSSGATRLFNRPANEVLGRKWSRQLVTRQPASSDPVDAVFLTGQPHCHGMTIQDAKSAYLDVEVQSIPICTEHGQVLGVVELVCNGKESKRHRGQFRSLQIAATLDPLTGVLNRRELEHRLEGLHNSWQDDSNSIFSVVFLDLDHFKAVNDRLSHAAGDHVLIDVARLLQDELYSGEIIGRYGGEEFVILCPEATLESAVERAERLRLTIMAKRFADWDDLRVTASFGVAQVQAEDLPASVMERADQALYDAKNQGRNRTCNRKLEVTTGKVEQAQRKSRTELVHSATIVTFVASDMLILKLTGFIEENRARILHVDPTQVVLQIGSSGLFTSWTASLDRTPVLVTMKITDAPHDDRPVTIKRLALNTTIEPIGRSPDPEVFSVRSRMVIEQLRSHLMAE